MSGTIVKLGDIGRFIRGSGIPKSDIVAEDGLPCIRYAEIYTEYGDVIRNPVSMVSKDGAKSALRLEKGDIIFPTSGETATEIGKAAAFVGDDETYVGGDAIVLRDHGQNAIFLAHALNSWESNRQKYRLATGNSVVHIYAQELAQISLCLPANSEQQKIVEILFDCDAAISACDEKLACCKDNVTKLVRYIFDERNEFLDGWCPVSEVCDIAIGGTPSRQIWTIGRKR